MCDEDLAAIVLQSAIRGCATNIKMADGLALNTGLMLELRTTHPLWADSVLIMQLREERQRKAEEDRKEQLYFVRSNQSVNQSRYFLELPKRHCHCKVHCRCKCQ